MPNAAEITHAVDVAVLATDTQPLCAGSCGRVAFRNSTSRQRVVRCQAIAAPAERPSTTTPAPGPIIMNGQILHSISEERLELVKSLGPHMESQVANAEPQMHLES